MKHSKLCLVLWPFFSLLGLVCRSDVSGGLQVRFGALPQPHLLQQHQPGGAGAGDQGRPESSTFPPWTVHCVTHFKHTHTDFPFVPVVSRCIAGCCPHRPGKPHHHLLHQSRELLRRGTRRELNSISLASVHFSISVYFRDLTCGDVEPSDLIYYL